MNQWEGFMFMKAGKEFSKGFKDEHGKKTSGQNKITFSVMSYLIAAKFDDVAVILHLR